MRPLRLSLRAAALAALLLVASASLAFAAGVTFGDDFTSGPLNTGAWKTVLPWGTHWNNREQQWYDPANLLFSDGRIRIKTEQRTVNGYPYASGIIDSQQQYSYGYYEMRAKLPKGKGVWPAFWLLHDGTPTAPGHEIDVMEMLGNDPTKVYMTYHQGGKQIYQATYTGPDFSADYHTFAVDWQPTYIRWYVDGVQRGEYLAAIPSMAQNIIANTAVGDATSWPGAPDTSTVLPQYFDIDYIRAYDAKPAPAPAPEPAPVTTPTPAPIASPPVASADAYTVRAGAVLSVAAPGVLANDSASPGAVLTASLAAAPAHGTVALRADGSFVYTPAAGYSGSDSFAYATSDGTLLSSPAPVTVTVAPAPVKRGRARLKARLTALRLLRTTSVYALSIQ